MRYNLLIVDDEDLIRQGMRARLEYLKIGCDQIFDAANGAEALEILDREEIDIAIADIRMPDMDGLELIERMQRSAPQVYFIVLSGYALFTYAQRAIQLGVRDYLLKPISNEKLEKAMKKIFDEMEQKGESQQDSPLFSGKNSASSGLERIGRIRQYMEEHYAEPLTVTVLAEMCHMSPNYFSTLFKKEVGQSAVNYMTEVRIAKASELLRQSTVSVADIAKKVGYEDSQYFFRVFKKMTGMTPNQYRDQASSPAAGQRDGRRGEESE